MNKIKIEGERTSEMNIHRNDETKQLEIIIDCKEINFQEQSDICRVILITLERITSTKILNHE